MDFHLFSSHYSSRELSDEIKLGMSTGQVYALGDSLDVGPLNDGRQRFRFWSVQEGASEVASEPRDVFAYWDELKTCLAKHNATRLFIWDSGAGEDYVMARMACQRLHDNSVQLMHVAVPPARGFGATLYYRSESTSLSANLADAVKLSPQTIITWATEFEAIVARPEQFRQCSESGELLFHDFAICDALLLKSCKRDWVAAARVVVETMACWTDYNRIGDGVLIVRLKHLIDTAQLECDVPGLPGLRGYNVRLPV